MGIDKLFHHTFNGMYDYLSMLWFQLTHVSKMGPWWRKKQGHQQSGYWQIFSTYSSLSTRWANKNITDIFVLTLTKSIYDRLMAIQLKLVYDFALILH